MANQKISELETTAAALAADRIPVARSGANLAVTARQIADLGTKAAFLGRMGTATYVVSAGNDLEVNYAQQVNTAPLTLYYSASDPATWYLEVPDGASGLYAIDASVGAKVEGGTDTALHLTMYTYDASASNSTGRTLAYERPVGSYATLHGATLQQLDAGDGIWFKLYTSSGTVTMGGDTLSSGIAAPGEVRVYRVG